MRKFFVSRLMGRSAEDSDPFPILDLPEQLVEYVLSFACTEDLVKNCRLVCVQFRQIVDRNGFWKIKCERDGKIIPGFHLNDLPANYYRAIYVSNPYGRNLLRNGHGDEKKDSAVPESDTAASQPTLRRCWMPPAEELCPDSESSDDESDEVLPQVAEADPSSAVPEPDTAAFQPTSKHQIAVSEQHCSDSESSDDEDDESDEALPQAAEADPSSAVPESDTSQPTSKRRRAVSELSCPDSESSDNEADEADEALPQAAEADLSSAASSSDEEPGREPPLDYEDDWLPRDRFAHWRVTKNHGDGWHVEQFPAGADSLPLANQSCFATSYGECTKEQIIALTKEGVVPEILDTFKPAIQVSEWYAARFDCGSIYRLIVELLDAAKKPVATFDTDEIVTPQWAGRQWKQVSHTFVDYPEGVRYVRFAHLGRDTQFWAGHYGAKMAGGVVRIAAEQTSPHPTIADVDLETGDDTSGAHHPQRAGRHFGGSRQTVHDRRP